MTKGTTKIIDLRRNLNALYHLHVRHSLKVSGTLILL